MGRKKKEVVAEEKVVKTRGRPKKGEEKNAKAKPKKLAKDSNLSAEDLKTLEEIEKSLLKKCKKDGFISQSEIYDALNNYELDDEAVDQLIAFFADSNIKVINEEEEEEEEEEEDKNSPLKGKKPVKDEDLPF